MQGPGSRVVGRSAALVDETDERRLVPWKAPLAGVDDVPNELGTSAVL